MDSGMNPVNFRVPPSAEEAKQTATFMKNLFGTMIDETLKLDQTQADQDKKEGDVFVEVKSEDQVDRITLKNGKKRCEGVETFKGESIVGTEASPESTATCSSERGHCGEGGKKPVDIFKMEEQKDGISTSFESGFKADGSGSLKFAQTKADGTIIEGYNVAFPA